MTFKTNKFIETKNDSFINFYFNKGVLKLMKYNLLSNELGVNP